MARKPKISDAEWAVMQLLWERSPMRGNDVVDVLAPRQGWSGNTVKTLLNRLVKKGALRFAVDGRSYLYRPAVRQEECVREEGKRFLARVFAGAAGPLLAHFIEDARLTAEEIENLKRLLEKKEG